MEGEGETFSYIMSQRADCLFVTSGGATADCV